MTGAKPEPIVGATVATTLALAAAVIFLAVAPIPWLAGLETGPAAGADGPPQLPEPRPANAFAAVTERPLFTATRRPVAITRPPADANLVLGKYRLTGVIVAPGLRSMILAGGDGRSISVAEGTAIDGWTVREVTNARVVLENAGKREVIRVPERAGLP
jgi:hypothetical protein